MRNKGVLALLLFAIAISVFALGKIVIDEAALTPTEKNYLKVSLVGAYEKDGVTRPLSDGFSEVEGLSRIVITGHFDRAIEKNQTLHMHIANLKVRMYINGTRVFAFGEPEDIPPYAHSAGNMWASFVSPGITPQDEIRIELSNVYTSRVTDSYQLFADSLYVDTGGSYLLELLRSSMPNTFYAVFVICLGVLFLVAALVLRSSGDLSMAVFLIGVLSISSGVWFLTDFNVLSLYLPLGVAGNGIDIVSLLTAEASIMLYLAMHSTTRLKGLLHAVAGCDIVLLIAGALLQLFGVLDYRGLYHGMFALLIAGACSLIIVTFYESIRLKRPMHGNHVPVLILGFGAMADIVMFFSGVENHSLPYKLSFLVFLAVQVVLLSKEISRLVEESARADVLRKIAYKDPLTGVRNRASYLEYVAGINMELREGASYGAAMFDLNKLKTVNDQHGHKYGDVLIQTACTIICRALKTSPVFRIGGDEFVAILTEEDRSLSINLAQRLSEIESVYRQKHPGAPEVSIACGTAFYDPKIDRCFEDVVARADWMMYQDKSVNHHPKPGKRAK